MIKRGRPTNQIRRLKYAIQFSKLHFDYLVPKRFRNPEIFGLILKYTLQGGQ